MILPFINLNGSSAGRLADEARADHYLLTQALESLRSHGPNGRDYIDTHALKSAIAEHCARIAAIQDVLRDLETFAEHCEDRR